MGRLTTFFARRYVASPKSHSVINIISIVSAFAIAIPVAAMVILLSVFNGFEGLVKQLYGDFDPDIMVTASQGKVIGTDSLDTSLFDRAAGIESWSLVLEDNALLEYRGRQTIATVRGVDSNYVNVVPIEGMIIDGQFSLNNGALREGVIGQGIAYNLGLRPALLDGISLLVPRRGSFSSLLPVDSYRQTTVYPSGVFALDAETDSKYIIVPIEVTRELFDYPEAITSVMIRTAPKTNTNSVRAELKESLGESYSVLTRYEQKASLYRLMQYEKWGIFIIIMMVLIIASFSVVGSTVMLIIDKKADIRTLFNIGAGLDFVRQIFLKQGMIISGAGAAAGMALGLLLCWIQIRFSPIRIPADSFLVDSYPVIVRFTDLIAITAAFIAVNYIITKFTVSRMIRKGDMTI